MKHFVLCVSLLTVACARPGPAEEAPAPKAGPVTQVTLTAEQIEHGGVRWSAVSTTPVADFVDVPGRLVPDEDHTARLSASVQGRVTAVSANVGDEVARGQVLVRLQSEEASARRTDLAKANAELAERQSALRYARSARERAERLLALKAGSVQDLERARTDEAAAEASVAQAQATVDQARRSLSVLEVDEPTGEIRLASPIAGVVVSRDVLVGSVVAAGASALVVTDPGYLRLEFGAPDAVASQLKPGQRLQFAVPGSDRLIDARVLRMSGALDPATRLIMVRAAVANPDRRLRSETFVSVRVESASQSGVTLPHDAVQLLEERPVVFLAAPDGRGGAKFVRRDVTIGTTTDGRTHILTGLKTGDVVVTDGAFAVKSEFSRAKMPAGG